MIARLKPNTILRKCIYLIFLATGVLLVIAGLAMSNWSQQWMMPRQYGSFNVLTEGVAAKVSYLLHQNTQFLLKYRGDENLLTEIIEKETGGSALAEVEAKLVPEIYGSSQAGSIRATRNIMIVYDETELICRQELRQYGEMICSSDWFRSYCEESAVPLAQAEGQVRPRMYSPAMGLEQEEVEPILSYAMRRAFEGHDFIFLLVEPLSDFQELLDTFRENGIDDFCLIGNGEEILYQSMEDSAVGSLSREERAQLFLDQQYTVRTTEFSDQVAFGSRVSYQAEELKIAAVVSRREILAPSRELIVLNLWILAVFTILLVAIVLVIVWIPLRKIGLLAEQMRQVENGSYRITDRLSGNNEVGDLARSFYGMVEQIEEDMKVIQEKEQQEERIRYSLLTSQIDPHFIYNTLNTITYLAEMNCTGDIQIINQSLISMLRDRLKSASLEAFDTLENEQRQLQNYITIQKYLCSGELSMTLDIEPECLRLRYPKNVLQPFVENAILHGILVHRDASGQRIPGNISVRIHQEAQELVSEIRDNGVGMTREAIARYFIDPPVTGQAGAPDEKDVWPENSVRTTETGTGSARGEVPGSKSDIHIGIYNIRLRMKYLYQDQFHIEARNLEEGGLAVMFRFPS